MAEFQNNSVFWVEVEKIKPNPFQPRREFDEARLNDLAESIRQYGVLQPLVVTRNERVTEDGGLAAEYELIAGERRLRASKIAGVRSVPVLIRAGEETDQMKLELAIIENLQREDLNPIDRALAFKQLSDNFGFTDMAIARKIGKSRMYVTNTKRLLQLPDEMQKAIKDGKMTEGHSRPILMLRDQPEEQSTLFKEVVLRHLSVRDAEEVARRIAKDKVKKKRLLLQPEMYELEEQLSQSFGTRVQIQPREVGGRIVIEFFSDDDIKTIAAFVKTRRAAQPEVILAEADADAAQIQESSSPPRAEENGEEEERREATSAVPEEKEDEGLYSVSNFSI